MKTKKRKGLSPSAREKLLMISLPCIAVIISILIIAPQVRLLSEHLREKELSAQTEQETHVEQTLPVTVPVETASTATTAVSLQSGEYDQCEPDRMPITISASSTERDMLVLVNDSEGNSVKGEFFEIILSSTYGQFSYNTTQEGRCYIVELAPGQYTVSVGEKPGYAPAPAISCTVKDKVEFAAIPDISDFLDVVDVGELSANEVKDNSPEASQDAIPEIIVTPQENSTDQEVVLDAQGNVVYTYSYNVGPNGFLFFRGSNQESDVIPVDENNDGVVDYGLRYVLNEAVSGDGQSDGQSAPEGYYVSVTLFNSDNSPVEIYDISAAPMTQPVSGSRAGWRSENGKTYYEDTDGRYVTGLKSIDGKLYYFNNHGEKASRLGVDVSCFNNTVNWAAVKAQGIDFAIVRVGGRGWESGLVYTDSMAMDHLRGAKAAGLRIGAYFYSTAVSAVEAVQEASVVVEQLGGMGLDMPVYIDMELSGSYPNGRADLLSTAQRVDIINAFCKTISSSGYAAGVYSGESLLSTSVDYNSIAQYSIWLANYTENNAPPSYPYRYDIWQFTDRGVVSGMGGNVDINVIF